MDWIRIHNKKDICNNEAGIENCFKEELNEINSNLYASFTMGNLKLNLKKTENYLLSKAKNKDHKSIKKLGTILNVKDDITNRINSCVTAFKGLYKCWVNNKYITMESKLRIYNVYVKSILLYNTCTLTAPTCMINKMNTIHRKHLRIMSQIFYPNVITNNELYRSTNLISITDHIFNMRWKYLGFLLRQKYNHPAFIVMENYYRLTTLNKNFKGRKLTFAKQLSKDLKIINISLNSLEDFNKLVLMAENEENWKTFIKDLYLKYAEQQLLLEEKLLIKRKNNNDNNNKNNKKIKQNNNNENCKRILNNENNNVNLVHKRKKN